jgi:hypothetical protein
VTLQQGQRNGGLWSAALEGRIGSRNLPGF